MRCSFLLLLPLAAACSSSPETATPSDSGAATDAPSSTKDGGGAGDDSATPGDGGGGSCSAARDNLLRPINATSQGAVTVLSDAAGVKTLYVDASAGGTQGAETNPRIYVSLESDAKVAVTDPAANASTAWDLAIKRAVLFTNDGDGGPGKGGAVFLDGRDFASVTSVDATSATFATESFFDADCNPAVDATGDVMTTFTGWYDYNQQQHSLTPHPGTYLVKGAGGKVYKLAIVTYYAQADGGTGTAGGNYVLKVAAL